MKRRYRLQTVLIALATSLGLTASAACFPRATNAVAVIVLVALCAAVAVWAVARRFGRLRHILWHRRSARSEASSRKESA